MEKVTLKSKLLDYARNRNDFFCVHDLEGFFSDAKKTTISGLLSLLTTSGDLIMTEKQSCTMQTNKHRYYIFHKKPVIPHQDAPSTPIQAIPKKTYDRVEEFIAGQKGDICVHIVSDALNMNRTTASDNLRHLVEKGILVKKPVKENCGITSKRHTHYIHKPKGVAAKNITPNTHKTKFVVPKAKMSINVNMTIDLNVVKDGVCIMVNNGGQKLAILREDNKIKIFKVME